jgi:MFS family permease
MPRSTTEAPTPTNDALLRHNVLAESLFSAFNGVYLGLAIFAAPVVAVTLEATPLLLTVLVSAFPVGAFLGPLWALLGRRWGMQKLVTQMALWANVPLFFIYFLDKNDAALFTLLITMSQLVNSAMRMGQSSMYRVMYPREVRGRVLGRLTFWSYVTMVPSILVTGWLLDKSPELFRVLFPFAGVCGLIGCWYYRMLYVPPERSPRPQVTGFRAGVDGVQRIISQDRPYLLFQFAFFLSGSAFFMSTHVILLMTRDRFEFGAFELAWWISVVPQVVLLIGSLFWGHILDRQGIMRSRLIISVLMIGYLISYFLGIVWGSVVMIALGSVLQGLSNAGGQLTWALASTYFAPRVEDVPLYNGIHFVLNGIRGLVMPWVGSILFVTASGPVAILSATGMVLVSVPIILRTLSLGTPRLGAGDEKPRLRVVGAAEGKSAG